MDVEKLDGGLSALTDVLGPLPKKPKAVFHHPMGFELYDNLAMDMHAMRYAEYCVAVEREACLNAVRGAMVTDHGLNTWKRCIAAIEKRSNVQYTPCKVYI